MPGYTGGVHSGAAVLSHPLKLLGQTDNGVLCRRLLGGGIPIFSGDDSGGIAVPHHFKCGGGHSGAPLGIAGDIRRGMYIWVG